jgi:tripartite-type tricarboxylate transporter receptor subunit TctC
MAGEVQATFISMGPHIAMVRAGSLRVLAAATPMREPYMPDTPTFAELGFPGFETSTWFSLFAPRGTPDEIIAQLNTYTRTVHEDPEQRRRLDANFVDPMVMSASEFGALVKADALKWERIVRETGVGPQ